MTRLGWVLVLVAVLLVGTGGAAAWAYAHRGYPHAVYYRRVVVTATGAISAPPSYETWVDPRPMAIRTRTFDGANSSEDSITLVRDGYQYGLGADASPYGLPLSRDDLYALTLGWLGVQRQGFTGMGAFLLAHVIGKVERVQLGSHRALRFATTVLPLDRSRRVVWLDQVSRQPLQVAWVYPDGAIVFHFMRQVRIPAGALPADFFDPPHTGTSLWDQALGWLQDRIGLHHASCRTRPTPCPAV